MSKMIDGNKLILALSDWWYSSFGLKETEESKAVQKVLDEVERYVEHEKSAGEWIPCSERLPSKADHRDDMVLVCYGNGSVRFNTYMNGWAQGFPIAWKPLPEPYKGGEEK